MTKGHLFGIGVGPGDPELITLKALKCLQKADIIAHPTATGKSGNALKTIEPHLRPEQTLLPLTYPATAGPVADSPDYLNLMHSFYDETANEMRNQLNEGKNIALICAGDPFIYGSFIYWHARLAGEFDITIVPGITSIVAGATALEMPLCHREDIVTIIPATIDEEEMVKRIQNTDRAVILKLGRTFPKVVRALKQANKFEDAYYIERASTEKQRIKRVSEVTPEEVAYFSIIVLPCETPV